MKSLTITLLFATLATVAFGQNGSDNGYEYDAVNYLQLKPNTVAKFYEIDNRDSIETDTIFIAGEYFLYKVFYEEIIDSVDYVIVKFPDFTGKSNSGNIKSNGTTAILGVSHGAVRVELSDANNGKVLCISKEDFDKLQTDSTYHREPHVTGGLLTLPFKFRGKVGNTPRSMTTDVTIGPYVGVRTRLTKKSDFFLTIPVAVGLTFINVNTNNTAPSANQTTSAIVPGFTIGSGLVFQLDKYELGLVGGWDFGTGKAGTDWIYNEKPWVSFAIGYSFLK